MRRAAVLFAILLMGGGIAGQVRADGTIILNSVQDFQSQVTGGAVTGADLNQTDPVASPQQSATNMALATAFPGPPSWNRTTVSALTPPGGLWSGLLSSGTAPNGQPQFVSAWTYGYHIDPDLSKFNIHMGLYLPKVGVYNANGATVSGVNTVSVALTSVYTDNNNTAIYGSRVWEFDNNLQPGILGAGGAVKNFDLAAADLAGAGGSNIFQQDPGFKIDKVLYFSIGYRGFLGTDYPVNPDPRTPNTLWIGTQALDVTTTPEPNSAVVLACCLLGTALVRPVLRARFHKRPPITLPEP